MHSLNTFKTILLIFFQLNSLVLQNSLPKVVNIFLLNLGIAPLVATPLKGRIFTVSFLLILAFAGGSNTAGPIA